MGNHLPYEITQRYLPPGRGDFPAFTPAEAGTRFSDPGGMQGWVDLGGCMRLVELYCWTMLAVLTPVCADVTALLLVVDNYHVHTDISCKNTLFNWVVACSDFVLRHRVCIFLLTYKSVVCSYKAKIIKIWNKLCKLKGRSPSTGNELERPIKFEGKFS